MGVQAAAPDHDVLVVGVLLVVGEPLFYDVHLLWKFSGPFLPIGVCDPWLLQSYNFDLQYRHNFGHEFYGLMSCMDCIHRAPFLQFSELWS